MIGVTTIGEHMKRMIIDQSKDHLKRELDLIDRPKKARTLIYDIETAPNLAYVWGKWQQDVIDYYSQWYMMCISWRWLGEDKTYVKALDDFPMYQKDRTNDYELVKYLRNLFDEADIIIAHNGNSFDQKKSNARFLVHDLPVPSSYKQIDTKLVAKRYFNFNSNKLDDLGKILGLGEKINTGGFSLWLGCMAGDKKAWNKMKKYNKQDVVLLEKVYLKMRPWIENHPGINMIENRPHACPKCGGERMQSRGLRFSKTNYHRRFQCQDCGGWSHLRVAEKTVEKVKYVN